VIDLLRLAVFGLVAYGALVLLAFVMAERVIFQPPPSSYHSRSRGFERLPVAEDGWIYAAHLPAPEGAPTILFSHGNAEDLGLAMPFLRQLHAAGFGVISYDYRGYGRSSGSRARVVTAAEDAEAVYEWAVLDLGIPPDRIIVHGRSLGSGPTLLLASRHPVAGVILESAFTSTYRVITRVPLLPFDRFPNLAAVRKLDVPVLVIHGTADEVIPVSHGRRLYAAAREPKQALWVEGAGHNDLAAVAGDEYIATIRDFAGLRPFSRGGGRVDRVRATRVGTR
jgi:abhydrolase domain-containing protein 17